MDMGLLVQIGWAGVAWFLSQLLKEERADHKATRLENKSIHAENAKALSRMGERLDKSNRKLEDCKDSQIQFLKDELKGD